MRKSHEIVLEALQEGLPVKLFGNREIHIYENCIGFYGTRTRGSEVEDVFLPFDSYSMNNFLEDCAKLTPTYVQVIAANLALTKIKRNQKKY